MKKKFTVANLSIKKISDYSFEVSRGYDEVIRVIGKQRKLIVE
jgi:hypothetical protein